MSPELAPEHPYYEDAVAMQVSSLVGTADEVVAGLQELALRTEASELMPHTSTHSLADRLASLTLIAEQWMTTKN